MYFFSVGQTKTHLKTTENFSRLEQWSTLKYVFHTKAHTIRISAAYIHLDYLLKKCSGFGH